MSKKLRKSRAKARLKAARNNPKIPNREELVQRPQPLPSLSKPASVTKPRTIAEESELYGYSLSELKRFGIIAGALFLLLIILYFLLR